MLLENARWFQDQLRKAGFEVFETQTAIIPIIIGDADKTLQFSQQLLERGIYIPAIRPPTVPQGTSRLRLTLMATHCQDDLDYALEKIKEVGKVLKIIT